LNESTKSVPVLSVHRCESRGQSDPREVCFSDIAVASRSRSGATILHADHGTQFTSWSFGENMRRWDLLSSFGTIGDCFDNAAMESFWARMQVELLNTRKWAYSIPQLA
jgi:transposase InsO family protein